MSGGSSGSQQVVQRQTTDVPEYLKSHYTTIANQAKGLFDAGTGPTYYPEPTYIPPTEQEMSGLNQTEALARQGSGLGAGLLGNIQGPLQDIISGQNGITVTQPGEANPYIMEALDTAAGQTADQVNSIVGSLGRLGSPDHTQVLARELGNLRTSTLANQVNTDLDRRMQAEAANIANRAGAIGQYASIAPTADELRYADANRLINVGAGQRGELQEQLADNIARFNALQSRPWDQLNLYNNILGGLSSTGQQTTTYQPKGSSIASGLGLGLTGLGILGSFL